MRESPREGTTDTETEGPAEESPRGRGERMRMGSVGVTGARGQGREGRRANVVEEWLGAGTAGSLWGVSTSEGFR